MSHVFVRSLAMAAVVAALARSGPAAEPAEPSAGELQRQLQALTERLAQLEQKLLPFEALIKSTISSAVLIRGKAT